jgi:hypothetical protein
MRKSRHFLASAILRLRGVRTIALIGRSGTGKSFRARIMADKMGIEVIVDDGLLIRDGSIVGGHSAKRRETLLSSTRAALFEEPGGAEEARKAMRKVAFRSVLIVGTSLEMTSRIAANLGLPRPSKVIDITEIATRDELLSASRHRRRHQHAVPLPAVHIRLPFFSSIGKRILARMPHGSRSRPNALHGLGEEQAKDRGVVRYSPAAIHQMVLHCVQEFDARVEVERVVISGMRSPPSLEVSIRIPYETTGLNRLHGLREYILESLEKFSGLLFDKVTLTVENIGPAGHEIK